MGLLDEAIREHLELKRRSGADPSEVAREEREALTPVFSDEHTEPDEAVREPVQPSAEQEQVTEAHAVPWEEHRQPGAMSGDLSTVAQETAELDMQAVMEEGADAVDGSSSAAAVAASPAHAANDLVTPVDDPLEWRGESGEPDDHSQPQTRGQERLSFE